MEISRFLLRTIGEAEAIPRGYGLAYWRFDRADGVFYPIPLNLIVRFALTFYYWIAMGLFKTKFEGRILKALNASRKTGWEIGRKYGYKQGYQRGAADKAQALGKELDAWLKRLEGGEWHF